MPCLVDHMGDPPFSEQKWRRTGWEQADRKWGQGNGRRGGGRICGRDVIIIIINNNQYHKSYDFVIYQILWTIWNPGIQFVCQLSLSVMLEHSDDSYDQMSESLLLNHVTMSPYVLSKHCSCAYQYSQGNILCFLYLLIPKSQSKPFFTVHCSKQW